MSLNDKTFEQTSGPFTLRILSARQLGEGLVQIEREGFGSTVTLSLRTSTIDAFIEALRRAAKDSEFNEREDIVRAQQMTGVRHSK